MTIVIDIAICSVYDSGKMPAPPSVLFPHASHDVPQETTQA